MRVCLICAEFFGWGSRGGFGYATRVIGRELVKKGIDVVAVIPQPKEITEKQTLLDGIKVIGIERPKPFSATEVFKEIDADVYHSQQPSLASYVAQQAVPNKAHIATLRDPRSLADWWKELIHPTHNSAQIILTCGYYENPLARRAIRAMDALYVPAHYLSAKSQVLYGLSTAPSFLPTPVHFPQRVNKAEQATVCFVGRWDRVKRPWVFFELAKAFPKVNFVAIGKAHNLNYERELREKYQTIPNLDMVGYVDQFSSDALSEHLSRAWILINTSAKEALPNTFIEACAHRCALISSLNPDEFASRFGYHVKDNNYKRALKYLLEDNRWQQLGEDGYNYIASTNELSIAADRHIAAYQNVISKTIAS